MKEALAVYLFGNPLNTTLSITMVFIQIPVLVWGYFRTENFGNPMLLLASLSFHFIIMQQLNTIFVMVFIFLCSIASEYSLFHWYIPVCVCKDQLKRKILTFMWEGSWFVFLIMTLQCQKWRFVMFLNFIYLFIFLLLFICAYKAWFISPPWMFLNFQMLEKEDCPHI
jgi:hypothetical protein